MMEHGELPPSCEETEARLEPPEMEEFSRYVSELTVESYRISEGHTNEIGWYTPGQVQEINPEAAEFDPELQELRRELDSWIPQGEQMSCAVACQTMVMNQLTGEGYTEQQLLDIGKQNGWYDDGTWGYDIGKIAEHLGMEVEQRSGVEASELTLANDPETKVLATVDCLLLNYSGSERICDPNHVVQVLRVENTRQGTFVILNDPGQDEGCGAVYALEDFQKAYQGDITIIRKAENA